MLELSMIGNLGQDATIKDYNGRKFIAFSVGENRTWKDNEGVKHESTTWVSCLKPVFNDQSTLVGFLKAGTQVFVRGRASTKVFQTRDGEYRSSLNCTIDDLQLLSSKKPDTEVKDAQPTQQPTMREQGATRPLNGGKNEGKQPSFQMQVENDIPF